MLSSLAWVPRGVPRQFPVRFEINQEEYSRIKALAKCVLTCSFWLTRTIIIYIYTNQFCYRAEKASADAKESNNNDAEPLEGQEAEAEAVGDTELPDELKMDEYDDDDVYNDLEDNNDDDDEDEEFEVYSLSFLILWHIYSTHDIHIQHAIYMCIQA